MSWPVPHADEQTMSAGEQTHQQQPDDLLLADDDPVEFPGDSVMQLADFLVQDFVHSSSISLFLPTLKNARQKLIGNDSRYRRCFSCSMK
jgi:hypothetical protein